jgi:hypothetical protein
MSNVMEQPDFAKVRKWRIEALESDVAYLSRVLIKEGRVNLLLDDYLERVKEIEIQKAYMEVGA